MIPAPYHLPGAVGGCGSVVYTGYVWCSWGILRCTSFRGYSLEAIYYHLVSTLQGVVASGGYKGVDTDWRPCISILSAPYRGGGGSCDYFVSPSPQSKELGFGFRLGPHLESTLGTCWDRGLGLGLDNLQVISGTSNILMHTNLSSSNKPLKCLFFLAQNAKNSFLPNKWAL